MTLLYTVFFHCTPVRHCELNPIELIWAQVKGFVTKNNTTFRLKDVKELSYAAFEKITKDVWTKAKELLFYFFI
jgi:transposase